MPVNLGVDSKGCFARWVTDGAKYYYKCDSESLKEEAKQKAAEQGRAIEVSKRFGYCRQVGNTKHKT